MFKGLMSIIFIFPAINDASVIPGEFFLYTVVFLCVIRDSKEFVISLKCLLEKRIIDG